MKWVCWSCTAEYHEGRPTLCGNCGRFDLLAPLPSRIGGRDVALHPRQCVGVVRLSEMRADDRRAPYGPPFDAWELGDPHAVELVGPPGGGKSTCATQMAISAGRRVDVLYVAVEEGHSTSLRKRSLRAGSNDLTDHRVLVADARTLPDLSAALEKCDPALVIVDSVTELGATPEEIATVLFGKSWIAVSQINSKGKPFGGHAFSHACDTVIDVNEGVAVPRKNRFGPMTAIKVFDRSVA